MKPMFPLSPVTSAGSLQWPFCPQKRSCFCPPSSAGPSP